MAPFDEKSIVSSTGALDFESVPKHLVVIGGGVIGLEMGSVWARLGAKVTIVEALASILANMDGDVINTMTKVLKSEGITVKANSRFTALSRSKSGLNIEIEANGAKENLACDKVLVAVGRRAFTKNLNLGAIGLPTETNGKIKVDNHFRTGVPGVFAIGDVIAGAMLAHKAEEEGIACAEIIAGKAGHVNYEAIPNVVYTWPEVASIGRTEEELKSAKVDYKASKFPFSANARAKCIGDTDGFVKLLADARTDRLIGAHIVGPNASELIAELAVAFEYGASSEDVARSVHAHPTLAEAIKEAALGIDRRAIHI
jgi:dihydrolipoamide dehydrogenase